MQIEGRVNRDSEYEYSGMTGLVVYSVLSQYGY
jgi:hypothetical protein